MRSILPLGIDQLLGGAVEGARLELKASWDEDKEGRQVLKTLCAFANDLQNLNGGYVVIGVAEQEGVAVRPVKGLADQQLDEAQKWLRGNCNRLDPVYMPVIDTPLVDGKRVLVLWAPASDVRPHVAPDGPKGERKHWIRIGSETVEAKGDLLTRLMQQTARVPFDDRRAFEASNEDLRISLAREFLHDVGSDLVREQDAERVYAAMQITRRQNGHTVPRNVGLLFFSDDPQHWFRGARIEAAEFSDDAGGDTINERVFKGPLTHQLRSCLSWLETMTTQHLQKQPDRPTAQSWVSYPFPALREALVNAVYHRSYEADTVEPTKIYLYPNRVEIISYPGPVDGIELAHLSGEKPLPPVQARNRRIGELLKELKLAEARGTGLPRIRRSMAHNGSPNPNFDFDEKRTYFRVTLPAHPEYVALTTLREYNYQKATGHDERALMILESAWRSGVRASSIATLRDKEQERRRKQDEENHAAFAKVFDMFKAIAFQELCENATSSLRRGELKEASRLFELTGNFASGHPKHAHAFAQTKLRIAQDAEIDLATKRRLASEAARLLERAIQMETEDRSKAEVWFDLAEARRMLNLPQSEIIEAYQHASELDPTESRYASALAANRSLLE